VPLVMQPQNPASRGVKVPNIRAASEGLAGRGLARATLISMVITSVVATIVSVPGVQVFAAAGMTKRLSLPIIYVIYFIGLNWELRRHRPGTASVPSWWTLLVVSVGVSSVLAVIIPRQPFSLVNFAQGVALPGGFMMFYLVGVLAGVWHSKVRRSFVLAFVLFVAVGSVTAVPFGAFSAVKVPVAFALLYYGLVAQKRRLVVLASAAVLLFVTAFPVVSDINASSAVLGEIVACGALLALAVLPRPIRPGAIAVGVLVAGWALASSPLLSLMRGVSPAFVTDVTLTHRAYEAAQVFTLVAPDPLSIAFGVGPGATVDLRGSPDAGTLAASGRDLLMVDNVHFLTSWILMKFGVFGLIVLGLALWSAGRKILVLLRPRWPDPFLMAGGMLFVSGIASAAPAATNFFTNPLLGIAFGVLSAYGSKGGGEDDTGKLPSDGNRRVRYRRDWRESVRDGWREPGRRSRH